MQILMTTLEVFADYLGLGRTSHVLVYKSASPIFPMSATLNVPSTSRTIIEVGNDISVSGQRKSAESIDGRKKIIDSQWKLTW